MAEYSVRDVLAYIDGTIEESLELENDPIFMQKVLFTSHDINMYNFCSDEVKHNYSFIKFLLDCFKNDLKFLFDVVINFTNCEKINKIERFDVLVRYDNLLDKAIKKEDDQELRYLSLFIKLKLQVNYDCMMALIEQAKKSVEDNEELKEHLGNGFLLVYDKYSGYKYIVDFFAKRMISDIICGSQSNSYEVVLKRFKSFGELIDYGYHNYIIDYISKYDGTLSNYVSSNIELLDKYNGDFEVLKLNWQRYSSRHERVVYEFILERVSNYMEYDGANCSYDTTQVLYYNARKLGILDKVMYYDSLNSEFYDVDDDTTFDLSEIGNIEPISFSDMKYVHGVYKLMAQIIDMYSVNDFISSEVERSKKKKKKNVEND